MAPSIRHGDRTPVETYRTMGDTQATRRATGRGRGNRNSPAPVNRVESDTERHGGMRDHEYKHTMG
jgi:hypothetical protein